MGDSTGAGWRLMHQLLRALLGGLALLLACGPLTVFGADTSRVPGGDADAALGAVFNDIEQSRLGSALEKVDALLVGYPNFRLAHLIRGDLLLARTRPLVSFGNPQDAPADKLADLREEAVARPKAYRNRPPSNYVPRYLLQMEPEQKYAIVVDTQRSRPAPPSERNSGGTSCAARSVGTRSTAWPSPARRMARSCFSSSSRVWP